MLFTLPIALMRIQPLELKCWLPLYGRCLAVGLRRFLVILTVALVIILAITVWFFPSNEDFRADNPFWNGLKDVSSSYPTKPLESLSALPTFSQRSTLIVIPYLDLAPAELEEVKHFVTQGGTLVLADDYGFGNRILEYMGLKARFSGGVLLDPLFCYKNKWLPRISRLSPSSITSDTKSLILNHATSLTDVDASDVLALSSSFSFLDRNDNQVWDEGEPNGPLPVIAQYDQGSGNIILVSDPSLFINSMEEIESNRTLIQNLANINPGQLFIDQSHLPTSNLDQTKSGLTVIRDAVSSPVGAISLVILALAVALMPVWRREEKG
jgi:hypothetical protein